MKLRLIDNKNFYNKKERIVITKNQNQSRVSLCSNTNTDFLNKNKVTDCH